MTALQMSEGELDKAVRDLLRRYGLFGYRVLVTDPRSTPGWPDWTIVGRGVLFRELKSAMGRTSGEQLRVGRLLRQAGQDWDVWRPLDLQTGRIAAELAELTSNA
jgi:hypothetical protein